MRGIAKRARRRPKALVSRRCGRVCGPSGASKSFDDPSSAAAAAHSAEAAASAAKAGLPLRRVDASPAPFLLPDEPPTRSLGVMISAPWYYTKPPTTVRMACPARPAGAVLEDPMRKFAAVIPLALGLPVSACAPTIPPMKTVSDCFITVF